MKKRMLEKIERIESLDSLVQKRKVKVEYRTMSFKLAVSSYQEQVDIVTAAALRGWLSDKGVLTGLVGESLVFGNDPELKIATFEDS
eukprot:6450037-Amphidinium_carterae.1